METENAGTDSDEEAPERTEDPDPLSSFPATNVQVSKAQEKELRRIRKTDFSWVSALCENV